MADSVRKVRYSYVMVPNRAGAGAAVLARLRAAESTSSPTPGSLRRTPETVVPPPKPSSTLSVATVQSVRIAEELSELHHIAQLRFNQPALSKADIVKLALKEAIHKVESKAACKSRTETTEPLPAIPPGAPIGGAQAAPT